MRWRRHCRISGKESEYSSKRKSEGARDRRSGSFLIVLLFLVIGNGEGLSRVHLDPDSYSIIFQRPEPAPDSLGLDFSDPGFYPLGLAGPRVINESFLV